MSKPANPRTEWTAVIPAAGRGSRLGFDLPKILYPVLGRPLIEWMIRLLEPFCERFVIVLAPGAREAVEHVARPLVGEGRLRWVIQPQPLGMAHALSFAEPCVDTPNALVAWGDQITLRSETVARCQAKHTARPNALLTLPTVFKPDPYIHIERDLEGRLSRVCQAREGEISVTRGESDCGLFLFDARALFDMIRVAMNEKAALGNQTGELNLLPLLPRLERGPGTVLSVQNADNEETLGVNTPQDAIAAARILRERREGSTA